MSNFAGQSTQYQGAEHGLWTSGAPWTADDYLAGYMLNGIADDARRLDDSIPSVQDEAHLSPSPAHSFAPPPASTTQSFPPPAYSYLPQSFPFFDAAEQPAALPPERSTHSQPRPVPTHQENWLDSSAHLQADNEHRFGYLANLWLEDLGPEQPNELFPASPRHSSVSGSSGDGGDGGGSYDAPYSLDTNALSGPSNMPLEPRQHARTSVVDLTGASTSPASPSLHQHSDPIRKRAAEATPPDTPATAAAAAASSSSAASIAAATKRRRASGDTVEVLDLGGERQSAEEMLLQAQQQGAIRAQQQAMAGEDGGGALRIGKRQCIICMENYTNATTTACGHFYCHECLIQALMAGERNATRGIGTCPVCRKPINRKRPNNVVPILFMKKDTYEKSRRKLQGNSR